MSRGVHGARRLVALVPLALVIACQRTEYTGLGDIISIDEDRSHVTIRHDAIPGLMGAMTMRFPVAAPAVLGDLAPGTRVRFTLRRQEGTLVLCGATPAGGAGPLAASVGVHDHTPHHGGVVGMSGDIHLEALAAADGRVRLYLTDYWRHPLPLTSVTGTVTLKLPDGERRLPLRVTADALEASGPALPGAEVAARFQLAVDGASVRMDFVLPLSPGGASAAGVPVEGCVSVDRGAAASGCRPRCTLDFARPVGLVVATPDGTTILVAALELGVSAWRMPAGRLALGFWPPPPIAIPGPAGLPGHPEAANAIAIRPDGAEAVVALEGRLLRYAIPTGRVIRELAAPRGVVRSLDWAPDGATVLVTVFYDAAAHLLRAEDGVETARLPSEHEATVARFSPDGRLAAVGDESGPIAVFDLVSQGAPRLLVGTRGHVHTLAFAGNRLVSGGTDGVVRLWDPGSGTLVREEATGQPVMHVAPDPAGRTVASTGFDGIVRLHDLVASEPTERLAWHAHQVHGLAWAGPVLVSGDVDGHVALWDLPNQCGAGGASGADRRGQQP